MIVWEICRLSGLVAMKLNHFTLLLTVFFSHKIGALADNLGGRRAYILAIMSLGIAFGSFSVAYTPLQIGAGSTTPLLLLVILLL